MSENKTPHQRREAEKINRINKQQDLNREILHTTKSGADDSKIPFSEAYTELDEFIDDLDHPIGLLFKDIAESTKELGNEVRDIKIKNPQMAKRLTEGVFLLSAFLFSSCSAREAIKDPVDTPDPIPIEEVDPTLGNSSTTEMVKGFSEEVTDPNQIINITKGKKVVSKEVEDSTDLEVPRIEEVLNEEVREILSLTTKLEFDNEGNLFFEGSTGEIKPVLIFETERHLKYQYTPVEEVKFFVIHYDGGPLKLASGDYRTVFNTLNGLNREGKPSVQFCVDPYPITGDVNQNGGLGIILSQEPNEIPYRGKHVQIGINLETGAKDVNRVKTARLYEEIGVGSNFIDFVNSGEKDFNSYSLGVEQVGTNYSINFPEQFPPKQQIANMVALSKAVADRYNLNIWDIVGHGDIQEKSDPGDEYMLTLRYLLGLAYVKGTDEFPEDFLDGENFYDFLIKLKKYGISKMGEDRYMQWNEVYGMEEVLRTFGEETRQTENVDTKYEEASNKEVVYEAILAATKEFAGEPYSWDRENHHCSGYVAQYFKYLGFPIDLVTDPVSTYTPNRGDPMPNATTVKQVKYLQMISENYGADLSSEITVKEMLSNRDIWEGIPAGTVLYLPERIGHHGYDTFTHTAIFMGLDANNEPMFSEFSSYMKEGPEHAHGFEQFTRMYKGQNIEPYNPRNGELKVFMFDAVEASKRIKLNRESITIRRDFSHKTLGQSGGVIR